MMLQKVIFLNIFARKNYSGQKFSNDIIESEKIVSLNCAEDLTR